MTVTRIFQDRDPDWDEWMTLEDAHLRTGLSRYRIDKLIKEGIARSEMYKPPYTGSYSEPVHAYRIVCVSDLQKWKEENQ